ncbi:MAG: hypothetical protein Q9220_007360 [cf. Caloplaca sp. 1 TL-2023]
MILEDKPSVLNPLNGFFLSLVVPREEVKNVKHRLEVHDLLDKTLKITPFAGDDGLQPAASNDDIQQLKQTLQTHDFENCNAPKREPLQNERQYSPNPSSNWVIREANAQKFTIPTVFEVRNARRQNHEIQANLAKDTLLEKLKLPNLPEIEARLSFRGRPSTHLRQSDKSLLAQAIRHWLNTLPSPVQSKLPANIDPLLKACSWTYTIYPPMLLLPPTFLSRDPWPEMLAGPLKPHLLELYELICQKLKVTHIAINAPIPALLPKLLSKAEGEANILRSPTGLVPLHGDFGNPKFEPKEQNFDHAFWVTATQNNITQVWAPLYTMFSRGNISEKTRLLEIKSRPMPSSGQRGTQAEPSEVSAVDLYAGIGYFAFSYAKAGVGKVLCWELNGWSTEGLRRGASKNGWKTKIVGDGHSGQYTPDESLEQACRDGDERLLVFHESNINAAQRVQDIRSNVPPIRHVNCGYLPSSNDSWDTAIQVLDPVEGGWVHAHENVATKDIEQRESEIVDIFRSFVDRYRTQGSPSPRFRVRCSHVERVKAYAPGVMHCVFDIVITPIPSSTS